MKKTNKNKYKVTIEDLDELLTNVNTEEGFTVPEEIVSLATKATRNTITKMITSCSNQEIKTQFESSLMILEKNLTNIPLHYLELCRVFQIVKDIYSELTSSCRNQIISILAIMKDARGDFGNV